jgi:hypothetical protein
MKTVCRVGEPAVPRRVFEPRRQELVDRGARSRSAAVVHTSYSSRPKPSHGLYVTDKTAAGFRVAENDGGHASIAFGYRIVAKPYGVTASRLPVVTAAQVPHLVRPAKGLRLR